MMLASAGLRARIAPEWGGGLLGLDAVVDGRLTPLMRASAFAASPAGVVPDPDPPDLNQPDLNQPDPNQLACYPLLPWSNRISDGGFEFDGRRIDLPRNRDDEPWPIHGSGWQRAWRVAYAAADEALLTLDETDASESGASEYRYRANLRYRLRERALEVALSVVNIGPASLPFGLGLHPFFPRDAETRLRAPADRVWLNDGRTPLPTELAAIPEHWRFDDARLLPVDCVDHGFLGWSGQASIRWPRRRLGLDIDSDVDRFVLYTPVGADFFCFEPVDHAIDAVHLPGGALAHGMTALAPGARLQRRFRFTAVE
ncbi:aldose 1-epimerase [Lysobacter sp. CA199]|uniref:aldose 1-epimerase n=1 Tax=Lysobacter sp. CA199 TaxID=3455608 RepID=UPI003F8D4435